MKYFFLLTVLVLFSCASTKSDLLVNQAMNNQIDSLHVRELDSTLVQVFDLDKDGFPDSVDLCPEEFGGDNGCPIVSLLIIEERNEIKLNEELAIKIIEQHESKTDIRVIDRSTSDVNRGWIAYSVPDEMKVAKSYSVKVRISKKSNGQTKADLILGKDDAINNPNFPTTAVIEDVKVSGEMSAELRGDVESFGIKALSTQTQNIDDESYTEWEWIVTPKKSGNTPLKLVIKVKELNKDIVVFNKNIQIKSNVPVAVEGFFDKYWQWFMTTIIIPIFIYFWNRNKKSKKS